MSALCNGTTLWDTDLVWYSSWPQFTQCFQSTVLVWVPCGWLYVTSPFYIYYINNVDPTILTSWRVYVTKMVLCAFLVLISVIRLVDAVVEYGSSNFSSMMIAPAIQGVTFLLAMTVMRLERKKGFITSGVVFVFWLLHFVAGLVPLYSQIVQKDYETHLPQFCIFCIYHGVVLMVLILSCVAETPLARHIDYDKEPCPEIFASFLSRITYWWITSLLVKGYKQPLTETDVYDLNPRDKSENNMRQFLKNWNKQKDTIRKRTRHKGLGVNVLYSNGVHKSLNIVDKKEDSPLLPKERSTPVNNELSAHAPKVSLYASLWKTFWFDLTQYQLWRVFSEFLRFGSPLLLGQLVAFTEDKSIPAWKGYTLCGVLFCAILLTSLFENANWFQGGINSVKICSAILSTIYRKALTMSNRARKESTVGEIVNLMSVDLQHIRLLIMYLWGMWTGAFKIIFSLFFIYQAMGPAMFAGLAAMLILMPINAYAMAKWRTYQDDLMKEKDKRMKIITEVLSGMKILKLYAWEPSFQEKIVEVRDKEIYILWKIALIQSCVTFTWTLTPYLVALCTFMTYVYTSDDHYLKPEDVFTTLSLLNILKLAVVNQPRLFSEVVQCIVSMRRITRYLNVDDIDKTNVSFDKRQESAVIVKDGTFQWSPEVGPILKNIDLTVREGEIFAIVGSVGSGKSSLVSAILGEMEKVKGHISIKSRIAYVPQQAWIQNDTLQNNILFGKQMNRQWYNKVIDCCALAPDLEMLAGGDMTEIGERGINLSGGQKQRVSLARAVYNNADIYLFDDPLSAVDSHVGKHIFDKLMGSKGLLARKTRILVTHGIQWLPDVDSIVVMDNGRISEFGTYLELLRHNGPFAKFLHNYLLETDDEDDDDEEVADMRRQVRQRLESFSVGEETDEEFEEHASLIKSLIQSTEEKKTRSGKVKTVEEEPVKEKKKLIEEEYVETGRIDMDVFLAYGKAIGMWFVLLSFVTYALYQASSIGSNLWISGWTDDSYLNNMTILPANSSERMDRNNYYLAVYGALGVAQTVFIMIFSFVWHFRTVRASGVLHSQMLKCVLMAPMEFFDTTPTGRLINRFSQEMDIIDTQMPPLAEFSINTTFTVLSSIIVISYTTPIFLVVIVPLAAVYFFVQRFYVTTSRQLKRLESKTRSPIYSHFEETLSGASVIRSYQAQTRFIKESEKRVDLNQGFLFYSYGAVRWQGIRLEFLGNIIILAASLFAVSSRDTLSGGLVGLSISYALEITSNLNWMVQLVSDLETQIVSVERVKQYTEIRAEPAWNIPERRPNHDWPDRGEVTFQDYSTRYREGLELVLKGITCTINPREKIGIVGRTGAGKSSLTLSLFRLIEGAAGEIIIDGINISSLGLHDLRSKLTILPQDPVLFAGSLRANVDPFNQYSDRLIWRALEHAHLKDFVRQLPGDLEHECNEGGENMSVGQRQLLCLARALLKKTKILVLDEATAAVDMATDDLIQQTIRSEFKDCTVITIAHRLNTVMDYDRILVLDNGSIAEFDSPTTLLEQPASIFYNMAKSAGLVT